MPEQRRRPRVTQRTIAAMAGVSQTTVSLVLNGKADTSHRIPEATRDRVLSAIRETTYVANPIARSLVGATNGLIGVFTYEQAFPTSMSDFYTELLTGIEAASEEARADLLMFTSSPVVAGRRRLFHESNRLRLADGCLLLGREMDPVELQRLVDTGFPFVALGRRAAAGGRVPFVGADYRPVAAALAAEAVDLGHRRIGLLHLSLGAEASLDRRLGVVDGTGERAALIEVEVERGGVAAGWERLRGERPTAVLVEDPLDALDLCDLLAAEGLRVPEDVSVVALGDNGRVHGRAVDLTRLSAPRTALGARAVQVLLGLLRDGTPDRPPQELLACTVERGATLAAAPADAAEVRA